MPTKKLARSAERAVADYPPYPGQGLPLPPELGLDGEWVIAERVFLFRADPPRSYGELLGVVLPETGREVEGFDADILAQHLRIDVRLLLLCNQTRRPKFHLERVPPAPPWEVCFRVAVQTPDKGVTYTFGRTRPKGSA